MDTNKKTICEQCRKQVLISDIKYVAKGKDSAIALCSECRSSKENMAKSAPGKPNFKPEPKKVAFVSPDTKKKVYFCSICKYKFKVDVSKKSKIVCPFCGRTNGIEEHEVQSADELVQKADSD
ncbi:hypothetical protein FJZ53_01925 [Candidatus Woesearchaeota archaeon]|nr:hypothetical protein [Candidatus Woesearchaeota archaeon]